MIPNLRCVLCQAAIPCVSFWTRAAGSTIVTVCLATRALQLWCFAIQVRAASPWVRRRSSACPATRMAGCRRALCWTVWPRGGLQRVFIEGGGITVSRFLATGCLDRLQIAIAPLIIGSGRPSITLPEISKLSAALRPSTRHFRLGGRYSGGMPTRWLDGFDGSVAELPGRADDPGVPHRSEEADDFHGFRLLPCRRMCTAASRSPARCS